MIRRRVGDALAVALTLAWTATTGAYIVAMQVAMRIEGRR